MRKNYRWLLVGSMCVLCGLLISGCSPDWIPQRKAETTEERKCVAEHEAKILNNVPKTLAGHDQDWDDAIVEAHKIAIDTCCQTRQYEFSRGFDGAYTGRMRDVK
jgi:hypothetical protein